MTLRFRLLPEARRPLLRRRLATGAPLRILEVHTPLSALIATAARAGERRFDGLWLSGFTNASLRALPDAELARFERRLEAAEEIAPATDLPLLADADTGGDALGFRYLCARLEAIGVGGMVVEDKLWPKRTSLAEGVSHGLEEPEAFLAKLAAGRAAMASGEPVLFARIEALIAGAGLEEALRRAALYLAHPAVDGVLIHSKDRSGADVLAFLDGVAELKRARGLPDKPLACIPTAYNHVHDSALFARGARLVIHANHMLRAAHKAMVRVAETILAADRSAEADADCIDLKSLFALIGVDERG